MDTDKKAKTIFSVGGGKGGIGKSIFSVALGAALAHKGRSVILADLDLGAANLHTYLGITQKTPSIADFILKKVSSLEDILTDTSVDNLKIISGAEFLPGMANPAHWTKLKIMRHIRSLPAEFIIIDLGAGVHFNTLDFFSMSDRGIVITAPEPAAIMNAYGFIKGALFRKLQNVFRRHPDIGPIIESEARKSDDEKKFTLDWLRENIRDAAPDMLPIIQEIENDFRPALILNRMAEGQDRTLVQNLITLCRDKLGVMLDHAGNIPDTPCIYKYLLNIPGLLHPVTDRPFLDSILRIENKLVSEAETDNARSETGADFSDEDVKEIIHFIEGLDENIFGGTNRNAWKLRMYFRPVEVVNFLLSRGITHEAFYRQQADISLQQGKEQC